MNQIIHRFCIGLFVTLVPPLGGAEFTNLNFESANLPVIPADEFGTWQPVELAMPGWTILTGSDSFDYVLHNNATLGTASVWINGPDTTARIFEGKYTVVLAPGAHPSSGASVDVSIEQHGWYLYILKWRRLPRLFIKGHCILYPAIGLFCLFHHPQGIIFSIGPVIDKVIIVPAAGVAVLPARVNPVGLCFGR